MAGALGIPRKQLANLLTRTNLADLATGRQGVPRRIDLAAVRLIDLVTTLTELGVPANAARDLAVELSTSAVRVLELGRGLTLAYDLAAHEAELSERLRDAAERVITRPRGRPRLARQDAGAPGD